MVMQIQPVCSAVPLCKKVCMHRTTSWWVFKTRCKTIDKIAATLYKKPSLGMELLLLSKCIDSTTSGQTNNHHTIMVVLAGLPCPTLFPDKDPWVMVRGVVVVATIKVMATPTNKDLLSQQVLFTLSS